MTEKNIPREGEAPAYLTFFIGRDRHKLVVRVKNDGVIIGRNTRQEKVDVDTKPFDGVVKGVSRNHAVIVPKKDYFFVKDLESANSTWLNRVRMRANFAEELYHGDVLHVGELRIEVYYTYEDEIMAGLGATAQLDDFETSGGTKILGQTQLLDDSDPDNDDDE